MRAVLIAHTKNTGIVRVMPAKSTQGWVGFFVFVFWQAPCIAPRQEHFIAELTDVLQKTTPDMPK